MTRLSAEDFQGYQREVCRALDAIGDQQLGQRIARDRESLLTYSGVRVPARRELVSKGFSFLEFDTRSVLSIWNYIWMNSPNADAMSCAIDYYKTRIRKEVPVEDWKTFRNWVTRVENWAHADDLCSIYGRFVAAEVKSTWTDVEIWNCGEDVWPKRVSIVSLIHYSGKNAVFMPFARAKPFLARCTNDHRLRIQMALGWVLREFRHVQPSDVDCFLKDNLACIGARVLSRALEHATATERREWRELRKSILAELVEGS